MSDEPQRPTADDRDAWKEYWTAQGMPWRTEPEVDEERQRYLAERRAVRANIEQGIYPFRDENGPIRLTRADVEWLLATHASGGMHGPVEWSDKQHQGRVGLDLRGADLRQVDLSGLPLTGVRGGLARVEGLTVGPQEREKAAVHLEGAYLRKTHLENAYLLRAHLEGASLYLAHLEGAYLRAAHLNGADFREACLSGANLFSAHLEGASLVKAHLEGGSAPHDGVQHREQPWTQHTSGLLPPANLRGVFFDSGTFLRGITLGNKESGFVSLADIHWGRANIAVMNWRAVSALGDERVARQGKARDGKSKDTTTRIREFRAAVRANRQLAVTLRVQGLNEDADRFAYRAQVLQRQVFRRQGYLGRALGSWLLDVVAGYGYRPMRSFLTYLLVVLGFAAAYFALGGANGKPLLWNEAIIVSMTAFHGRGFFSAVFQPGDVQAAVAAVEAFIGLLIEITFIATFTQRFFAR